MEADSRAFQVALERWLGDRLPGAATVEVGEIGRPVSGYSAETVVFTARWERYGAPSRQRLVLRRETPDPAVYPQQVPGLDVEVEIQYRAMEAVASASEVPIAPLVGFEPDPAVLGAPFFVMEFVEGQVPIESPIYTSEGFFAEARPDDRARLVDDGLRILAAVHSIDWRHAGLEWLVPPGVAPGTARQVEVWRAYAEHELAGRSHPPLERAFEWLVASAPSSAEDEGLVLNWGDPRPGNIIWRDFRGICVTDWEAVAIGPPEIDLGWWLMFDRWSHEGFGVERLPGEPTREEQREIYARYAGRDVGDTSYYELFAAARYAAIVVRVMNRSVARGELPADQTFWRENSIVDCLTELLSLHAS